MISLFKNIAQNLQNLILSLEMKVNFVRFSKNPNSSKFITTVPDFAQSFTL